MKKTRVFILTGLISYSAIACVKSAEEPGTPIFEGTTEIMLSSPNSTGNLSANGLFMYSVPSEVKYLVFGLFNNQITTSGKTITNPAMFQYGSRDGVSDFVRGQQARPTLHNYNQVTKDFDSTAVAPPNGVYYWAVWGYDQYGNVTHSSRQRQVTLQ
jgi:hypothetical protein